MASSTRNRASTAAVDGLNPDDPGIALLAQAVADRPSREILLVCCGDVPGVGPEATRLVLDVREREGAVARAVALDDEAGSRGPAEGFGDAIVWPRPHLGKDFSVWCLARGALALRPGGTLWCAARKAKGAESLEEELRAIMGKTGEVGEVEVAARDKGYRLVCARRAEGFDEARARAAVAARYAIEDPALPGLVLASAPGVFSRRELDGGTRQLLEHATTRASAPATVLDLGCGVGPLALWAATRWPAARVVAVDTNLRAVALARENAARHGLDDRVRVLASDGLPASTPGIEPFSLALVNPPTHAEPEVLGRLCQDLRRWLAPGGVAMLVVSRPGRMTEQLVRAGARVEAFEYPRFTVLEARWA